MKRSNPLSSKNEKSILIPSYLSNLLNPFLGIERTKKGDVELEYRIKLDFPFDFLKSKLEPFDYDEITTVYYYPNNNIRVIENSSKQLFFQSKQIINKLDFDLQGYPIRLALSMEDNICNSSISKSDLKNSNYNRYRHKYCKKWFNTLLSLTLIKENNKVHHELELEFYNSSLQQQHIHILNNLYNLFKLFFINPIEWMSSKELIPVLDEYNNIFKKFLSNNIPPNSMIKFENKPISIDRNNLYNIINNTTHTITNKLNGERYYLYIYNYSVFLLYSNGSKLSTIKVNMYKIGSLKVNFYHNTILDGEYYNGEYYIFDVLFMSNYNLTKRKHSERLQSLFRKNNSGFSFYDNLKNISMKLHIKEFHTSIDNCINYMKNTFGNNWDKFNDGIIFTPINSYYINKETYKWKFYNQLTIDVLIKKHSQYEQTYIYNMFAQDVNCLVPFNVTHLIHNKEIADDTIVEASYNNELKVFKIDRIRFDKSEPNFISTVKSIWNEINNPIKLDDIQQMKQYLQPQPQPPQPKHITCESPSKHQTTQNTPTAPKTPKIQNPTSEFFLEGNLDDWKQYRSYSNQIKRNLINKYCKSNNNILDIGFGRGGDMSKYKHSSVNKIYGVDPSHQNLLEAKMRHRNHFSKLDVTWIEKSGTDSTLVDDINDKIDVVSLFFCLTFFFKSKDYYKQLLILLYKIITKTNSSPYIIGTTMDGNKTKEFITKYKWDIEQTGLTLYAEDDYVYINIIDSIVTKQKEYMVNFEQFIEESKCFGFELVEQEWFNFNLPTENTPNTKNLVSEFSKLNRAFVFKFNDKLITPNINELYTYKIYEYKKIDGYDDFLIENIKHYNNIYDDSVFNTELDSSVLLKKNNHYNYYYSSFKKEIEQYTKSFDGIIPDEEQLLEMYNEDIITNYKLKYYYIWLEHYKYNIIILETCNDYLLIDKYIIDKKYNYLLYYKNSKGYYKILNNKMSYLFNKINL